jgi:hypothetical protein
MRPAFLAGSSFSRFFPTTLQILVFPMPPKPAAKKRVKPPSVEPVQRTRTTRSTARQDNANGVASKDTEDTHNSQNTRTDDASLQGGNSRHSRSTHSTTCQDDSISNKPSVTPSKENARASSTTDVPMSKTGPPRGVKPDAKPPHRKEVNMSANPDISRLVFVYF